MIRALTIHAPVVHSFVDHFANGGLVDLPDRSLIFEVEQASNEAFLLVNLWCLNCRSGGI